MIIKLERIINLIQSPLFKILYKKNINPLKDVKQEKKPLKTIFSFEKLNLFAKIKPTRNDPITETIKLLFINILRKVPA